MDLIFFNGTVMRGMPDHGTLLDAEFVEECFTAPIYRLFSVDDRHPGMFPVRDDERGYRVLGELYRVSTETWSQIARTEPPNLYRGWVRLFDGRAVYGMLYPRELCVSHQELSEVGSWRVYVGNGRPAGRGEPGACR